MITTLLLGSLMLSVASPMLVVSSFAIQRPAIARTMCVQRNVSDNACQGMCQLRKILREKRTQEQRTQHQQVRLRLFEIPPIHGGSDLCAEHFPSALIEGRYIPMKMQLFVIDEARPPSRA